jgi:hypothetical protein
MDDFEGHCICGSVRFTVAPPTLFCAHCHCRFCRLAHGAPFVTWVGVPEEQFSFSRGEDLVTWHRSSQQSRRGFCSRCGSTMFYVSTLSPGEIHIARSQIEGEIDREPRAHVFFDQRVGWISVDDDLLRVDSESEVLAKYKQVRV